MSADLVLKNQIIQKAWEDQNFLQQLMANPKEALKEAFGVVLPDHVQLRAVQESETEMMLVIPPNPAKVVKSDDENVRPLGLWM